MAATTREVILFEKRKNDSDITKNGLVITYVLIEFLKMRICMVNMKQELLKSIILATRRLVMNAGVTYIEINYDSNWVNNSLANLAGFSWLYEWGMYIFLIVTIAILFWVFFDSITKKKDQKALIPRILAIVGFFAIIPSFIFRFTGNADGVSTLVRLGAESGTPYYPGPINWNVNWLVSGYGPIIATIALLGVVISIAALVIYASSVQRAKPSTEFVQAFNSRMSSLESKVEDARRNSTESGKGSEVKASKSVSTPSTATIIDRKPQAATIIDLPKTGDTIVVQSGNGRGVMYELLGKDMIIGRDPSNPRNDIVIDDGKVSAEHARLVYSNGAWAVLDLGSTNGTYLNDIKVSGQQALSNGDKIRVGDTVLRFGSAR